MRRKIRNALGVWVPTGERYGNIFRAIWRVLSSPVFLVAMAVVTVAAMIFLDITDWRVGAFAPSAVGLAVLIIFHRRRTRGKLIISKRQAKKHNTFSDAVSWLGRHYHSLIDTGSARTREDSTASVALFRYLGEALIELGLYCAGRTKVKPLTGDELVHIRPIEYYVDFILNEGRGYVLIEPSVPLIAKVASVDERVISHALRNAGFADWSVERVDTADDILLFILKDEAVSHAYDFSG